MLEQGMKMFKIKTEGSAVSICDFEQVNICIYNVT